MSSHQTDELNQALVEEMNRIRGQLLGLIESWNLPDLLEHGEQQERGAKSTLKTLTYQSQARLQELLAD